MRVAGESSSELWVCHLGSIPYREALELQEQLRERRQAEEIPDTLLLLEHPPVYTRGRRSAEGDLSLSDDFYRARGIEVVDTRRGGKLTYHGPGQLVGYAIMRIADVQAHLRTMETALVAALAEEGIGARSRCADGPDYTGVWVAERKIASIGVHVSRGVSAHGFAVNVENDLEPFSWVVACGLSGVQMTSLQQELQRTSNCTGNCTGTGTGTEQRNPGGRLARTRAPGACMDCFRRRAAHRFAEAHGLRQRLVSPGRLGLAAPPAPTTRRVAVLA
jgi:lipoyl(octanoyl) transferase